MKKGKIILCLASSILSILTAFTTKHNARHRLFVSILTQSGLNKACLSCNMWTIAGSGIKDAFSCVTSTGMHKVQIPVGPSGHHTLYTQKTAGGKCKGPNIHYTFAN